MLLRTLVAGRHAPPKQQDIAQSRNRQRMALSYPHFNGSGALCAANKQTRESRQMPPVKDKELAGKLLLQLKTDNNYYQQ